MLEKLILTVILVDQLAANSDRSPNNELNDRHKDHKDQHAWVPHRNELLDDGIRLDKKIGCVKNPSRFISFYCSPLSNA